MEIEAKFRITGAVETETIDGLDLTPYSLTYLGSEQLRDELVDTPDRALAARGYALRRRRQGNGVMVTLKGAGTVSGAVHSRTEIEALADPEDGSRWPEPIWADVRDVVGGEQLSVISTVDNRRRLWRVELAGAEVAELALDEGEIVAGGLSERFHELEVEVKGRGHASQLENLGDMLKRQLPLENEERSKFARGLALLHRSERRDDVGLPLPARTAATRPMLAVGRDVVLRNLEKFEKADPVAREGSDPEGVHQLRVATRRLRAALQVLEETVADPVVTRRFRRGLRTIANSAGAVRDADVFLENLDAYAADVSEDEAAGLGPLRELLERRRAQGRKQMLKALKDKGTARLLREIGKWAEKGAGRAINDAAGPQPIWVRHFVRSAVWRRYEEILAYETVMPAPIPVLHRLRVSVKRMRYTAEFFEDAFAGDGKWLLKRLGTIQDHLGVIQDADVAIEAIDELARDRRGTAALQSYRDLRRRQQTELAGRFTEQWHSLTDAAFRSKLSGLLAEL